MSVLWRLATAAAADFGLQAVCGATAIALGTEKFYDLAGAASFLVLAQYAAW